MDVRAFARREHVDSAVQKQPIRYVVESAFAGSGCDDIISDDIFLVRSGFVGSGSDKIILDNIFLVCDAMDKKRKVEIPAKIN